MSSLIVCFSHTGHTKIISEHITERLGIDRVMIMPRLPYPLSDAELDRRVLAEVRGGLLPALTDPHVDITGYGYVFLGYPIWCGEPAPPILTFINRNVWFGKTVIPFMTCGGTYGRGLSEIKLLMKNRGASVTNELILKVPDNMTKDDEACNLAVEKTDRWLDEIIRRFGTNITKRKP